MEANVFISKLKANGSESDLTNLDEVCNDYKNILMKLPSKDRGTFSLNVLCILCRNIEKVPSWCASINNKPLLTLSIDCVRETRSLTSNDKVKVLACVYHIHRHVVRQNTPLPPEMVLKLSYLPFDDILLIEYAKTYWNIIADRISYIEKLKTKLSITKLLPKLCDDVIKVIGIYETVQFCTTILTFLVKKLHFLFNEKVELNQVFVKIFQEVTRKNDLRSFKKLQGKDVLQVYTKLNDCLYVVVENCLKTKCDFRCLNLVVQTCIAIVGHCPDLLHCLQTIYLNGFCSIFTAESIAVYTETILDKLTTTCQTTEKLGYNKAMTATYPYINQFLRLFIENSISEQLTNQAKMAVLKLMQFLFKKLKNCQQILKCENCVVKSGLHDALRLSFLAKNLIGSKENSTDNILNLYYAIVLDQYEIIKALSALGCVNYEKCYKKLQSDVHNTAITLNKLQSFEYSIKLFEIYIRNEILHFKIENDMRNISRALYNKSICELDAKNYEKALEDAYLSMVFAYPDGLTTEKYMSLVMDIKAKVLKTKDDDTGDESSVDELQMMTVLDICADAMESKKYGCMKPFFCVLKFSELLRHEFDMYIKLWPSLSPVSGVWKTLRDLTQHDVPWLTAKDEDIQQTLYKIVLKTPTAVRTIHNEHFAEIVRELVENFKEIPAKTTEHRIVHATLLLYKCEYDLADASLKYGWKVSESNMDPDQMQMYRSLAQEHDATVSAIQAVEMWTGLAKEIHTAKPSPLLRDALQSTQLFVPLLLHLYRTLEGLQLAYVCCVFAQYLNDQKSYVQNASAIIYHANKQTDEITNIITVASQYCKEMIHNTDYMETALVFLCNCAIFYHKIGSTGIAARLVQTVQGKILNAYEKNPEINLDVCVCAALDAQAQLCSGAAPGRLASVSAVHRQYLIARNNETKYTVRRLRALYLKLFMTYSGLTSTVLARRLLLWRRARSACACAVCRAAAIPRARLCAAVCNTALREDGLIKIDRQLKYMLGLPTSMDQPISMQTELKNSQREQRQDLEIMLENMSLKTPSSPTFYPSTSKFCLPEFLTHEICSCYACSNKFTAILTCQTFGLEASVYFRAKDVDSARNFFDGALKCCVLTEKLLKRGSGGYERFLMDIVENRLFEEFRKVKVEILTEAAFFELSQKEFQVADEYVVRIHEILAENEDFDPYLKNEVLNLMAASAVLRKDEIKKEIYSLEDEFDSLKLSPRNYSEPPKTPEAKAEKPPKIEKVKVKDEEIPNTKRKVIKLNLDEVLDEKESSNTKKRSKRTEFKIPVPVTVKPVLESMTPTPRRKKPDILVTQPSTDASFATPKVASKNNSEFFTPGGTPDQFFTPMTSIKTYSKKTLRHGIVKNLEQEFATPKSTKKETNQFSVLPNTSKSDSRREAKKEKYEPKKDKHEPEKDKCEPKKDKQEINKENVQKEAKAKSKAKVETGSLKTLNDKRTLKRATSPGKLEKDKPIRVTRRQPVRFIDEDKS